MKAAWLFLLLTLASTSVGAEDYYWEVLGRGELGQFLSADGACHASYNFWASYLGSTYKYDYEPPYSVNNIYGGEPGTIFQCDTIVHVYTDDGLYAGDMTASNILWRYGDQCPADQTYNPLTGACEASPDDDQDQPRKELGNPSSIALAGPISCVGNPINPAIGNKFQQETDYQDTDGELRFIRYYNGLDGQWRHNYSMSLSIGTQSLALTFADGRTSLFSLSNGVATAEATELGNLQQNSNGQWVYTSPTNEQFSFDTQGRLVRWQLANGLAQTLSYAAAGAVTQLTTVTDSRGHTLQLTETTLHAPMSLSVNGMTIQYGYDDNAQLATVTHSWPGYSTTRRYLYEDSRNGLWLTGIIDERGVRFASWAYDDQGRAVMSQHAGGAGKVTVTYNADGSSTVSNALGNNVTYQYQVINGLKRITAINGEPAVGCPAANTRYTYDTRGQMLTRTDALGHITAYTYDAQGRQLTQVEAQGTPQERTTTTAWYGNTFLPASITTIDRTISYSYDAQGRLLSTTIHANHQE